MLRILAAYAAAVLVATATARADDATCPRALTADVGVITQFLRHHCYIAKGWAEDIAPRQTGPVIDGHQFGSHDVVRIHYPPVVYQWLKNGRPKGISFPDGTILVKEQYSGPSAQDPGKVAGWTFMLRDHKASWDGWYWGYIDATNDAFNIGEHMLPYCINCHAGADNPKLMFSALSSIEGGFVTYANIDTIAPNVSETNIHAPQRVLVALPKPLAKPDPAFLALYDEMGPVPARDVLALPPASDDHVVPPADHPQEFVTSDICGACHDANSELKGKIPAMIASNAKGTNINLSPYGEWSASLMGLSGRDPVFQAQLETEQTLHPELADYISNTCYRCHGAAGQRQLAIDSGGKTPFRHDMVYATGDAPYARYGALARDGITCTVCHHIADKDLGTPASFTGRFETGPAGELYGPFADPKTYAMHQAIGVVPKEGDWLKQSKTCGSCHTVILPVLDKGASYTPASAEAAMTTHEQATYLEWLNSAYQNVTAPINQATAKTCQDCHMPTSFEGKQLSFRIANIQDHRDPYAEHLAAASLVDLAPRAPFARHTLLGINLYVMAMFQQFHRVLGVQPDDVNLDTALHAAVSLLEAAQESEQLATTASAKIAIRRLVETGGNLQATVDVTNLTGHKFPSGVGFRRLFIEFAVEDANGKVLWSSGATNPLGVIVDGKGQPLPTEFSGTKVEPHHQVIDRQDEAQIYESRHLDSTGHLTTSFLGLKTEVKDNRLLPLGWSPTGPYANATHPVGTGDDPRYGDGSGGDTVIYKVPLDAIPGAAKVRAVLRYQAIPPYYLRDRFATSQGAETRRLYYLASRLKVNGTAIDGWTLNIAEADVALR